MINRMREAWDDDAHWSEAADAADDQAAELRELMDQLHAQTQPLDDDDDDFDHDPDGGGGSARAVIHEHKPLPQLRRIRLTCTDRPRVITVASGKAGVGRTAVATALASTWARAGVRSLLIDAGVSAGTGHAGVRLGAHSPGLLDDALRCGCSLLDSASETAIDGALVLERGGIDAVTEALDRDARERLAGGLDRPLDDLDAVILDCGWGPSASVRELLALGDAALIVTTPDPASVGDAYVLLKTLVSRDAADPEALARLRLIVNQARDASEAEDVAGRIAGVAGAFLHARIDAAGWMARDTRLARAASPHRPALHRSLTRLAAEVSGAASLRVPEPGKEAALARALRMARGVWGERIANRGSVGGAG